MRRHGDNGNVLTRRSFPFANGLGRLEAVLRVKQFSAFTPDNDPYGEHAFGTFALAGETVYWKIDYYAPDLVYGSDDPTNATLTTRVLTILLASEY